MLDQTILQELHRLGHSLGSGVAALLADRLGGIPRDKVRCYAVAPARCMSLNLAVKYADVIHSIVLQDDFLPRTPTPLEDIFKLPCLLFLVCLRDTFIPEGRKLRDPRRLYAPGRMYHIVERKFCRCGRFPPEVRTAIPVDGRFEHIVLSCNATSDHGIVWIERESEKALQRMKESSSETVTAAPGVQKIERLQTIEKEHKDALERAVSLNVPHAVTNPEEVPSQENEPVQRVRMKMTQKLSHSPIVEGLTGMKWLKSFSRRMSQENYF
ncbi:sn1-specific diacylglycerol lipase alpha [Fagus crenata]